MSPLIVTGKMGAKVGVSVLRSISGDSLSSHTVNYVRGLVMKKK